MPDIIDMDKHSLEEVGARWRKRISTGCRYSRMDANRHCVYSYICTWAIGFLGSFVAISIFAKELVSAVERAETGEQGKNIAQIKLVRNGDVKENTTLTSNIFPGDQETPKETKPTKGAPGFTQKRQSKMQQLLSLLR